MPTPVEPFSLRSQALSLAERCLRIALAALSLGFILLFLYTAIRRMHYPFSMEQIEGNMLSTIWRLAHGLPVYSRPTPDFVPFLYSPLYYYVVLAVTKLTGVSYFPLRLVSTLSTLGTFAVLYAFVFGETRKYLPALAAAGFYAACYHPVLGWFDLARVDSLSVFFFVLAIYCTRRGPIVVAALVWTLAFQTKQGVLPIALLIICSDILTRPRRTLLGLGSLIAGIGGSILILNHATNGWYDYYVFSSTKGLGWLWRQFVFYIPVDFLLPFGIACLLILAAALLAPPSWRSRGAHFFLLTSFSVYAGIWFLRAHNGSSQNTLIPAYAWTAILFGLALARIEDWLPTQPAASAQIFSVLILTAATAQLAAHIYQPGRYIPAAAVRQDHQRLIDQLRAIPGDLYIFEHSDDELFAGKPQHAVVDAFGLITQGPPSPQRTALIQDFRQDLESGHYSGFVFDQIITPAYLHSVFWPTDLLDAYPVRIPAKGTDVGDVTSGQPREKWIYLPCTVLDHDLGSIIQAGAAISYGNCPNAPDIKAPGLPTDSH